MTVDAELEVVRAALSDLMDTPCAGCSHPYRNHWDFTEGRCLPVAPYGSEEPRPRCRCKRFVDPSETLAVG